MIHNTRAMIYMRAESRSRNALIKHVNSISKSFCTNWEMFRFVRSISINSSHESNYYGSELRVRLYQRAIAYIIVDLYACQLRSHAQENGVHFLNVHIWQSIKKSCFRALKIELNSTTPYHPVSRHPA